MDQNNYITIEMNIKVSMKDYRIVLGLKRTWLVALLVGLSQLVTWAIKSYP